jgi:hypothetical protein
VPDAVARDDAQLNVAGNTFNADLDRVAGTFSATTSAC